MTGDATFEASLYRASAVLWALAGALIIAIIWRKR